ncbi:hypothetical protein [Pseudomonas sp. MF6787]|uniref:hypothetical protein n=1 Tax=Pseudomonas sp. MF6787 TaxID=2797536 RepID=UPI0018E89BA6|nr:hypothetical protein [Pseudomonas sp. MF6787]MBJ2265111.1 hypothetical protein [Pseudomonas sp. MF6787]
MGNVVSLEDMRPHVVVHSADAAHVLPCSLLEDVAKGAKQSEILTEPVMQRIIEEWLGLPS